MGHLTKAQAKVKREALRKIMRADPSITTAQLKARGYKEQMICQVRKELKQGKSKDPLFFTKKEKQNLRTECRKTNNDLFLGVTGVTDERKSKS